MFLQLLPDVMQGSILGLILTNVLFNNLFFCLTKSELHNFAGDNTPCDYLVDLLNL